MYARANIVVLRFNFAFLRMIIVAKSVSMGVKMRFLLHCRELEKLSKLSKAA